MIQAIDGLSHQKTALLASPEQQAQVFEQEMAPLSFLWKRFMPQDPGPLAAAQTFGFYNPSEDSAAGLEAIAAFEQAGTWQHCVSAIERAAITLNPVGHGLSLEPVKFTLLLGSPKMLRFDYGAYTGFQAPGMALVMGWPNPVSLPRLPVAAAHEFNHLVRFAFEPWTLQTTVGQYLVAEGLAEAFGLEVVGNPTLVGPYCNALSPSQIQELKPIYAQVLQQTGDIRGYMFGDWAAARFGYTPRGVPDFAGYSMGLAMVQAFLERSGLSATQATYVPWQQIVQESGFWD